MFLSRNWKRLSFSGGDGGPTGELPQACEMTCEAELLPRPGRHLALGVGGACTFSAFFVTWSLFAPLASVTTAKGMVESAEEGRTLIHPDGGTVKTINVKEGDVVRRGSPIITLDGTALDAELLSVKTSIAEESASLVRVQAELQQISSSRKLPERQTAGGFYQTNQDGLLHSHSIARTTRRATFEVENSMLERSADHLRREIEAVDRELYTMRQDVASVGALYKSGEESLYHLNQQLRLVSDKVVEREELDGKLAELSSRRAMLTQTSARDESLEVASLQMEATQAERALVDLRRRKTVLEALTSRLIVRATIDGRVSYLSHRIAGESLPPGAAVAEVVPYNEPTVVEARVDPTIINDVHVGQRAELKFLDRAPRARAVTTAQVTRVSDTLIPGRDGQAPYFPVFLHVDETRLPEGDPLRRPGVPLQVAFVQPAMSVFAYLLAPMTGRSKVGS